MGKTWVHRTHYDGHGLEIFSFIALLDTHSRVGRRWPSPVVTLEDRCMHTFEFSRGTLVLLLSRQSTNLRIVLRQKWMDGSFSGVFSLAR